MIKKQLAMCVTVGLVGGLGFAQEVKETKVAASTTTAAATQASNPASSSTAAVIEQATTATAAHTGSDATRTSMSALMAKNFSEEKLEVRWKAEEQLYQEAGIPAEKIQKLHDLNLKTWRAMASGEKTDYQAFIRERNAILTPYEMTKFRATQRDAMAKRMRQNDGGTTAPQS